MTAVSHVEVRIIHLARATRRRELMEAELARAGMVADGWAGVDGSDPANAPRLAELPDSGPWGQMDTHAKGCLLSHLDAMTAFLAGSASHLVVLEDDVFLADDLGQWIAGAAWPEDASIVKLERWQDDRLLVLLDSSARHHAGRILRRMRTRHSGSAGYMMDRQTAKRAVTELPRNLPIDHGLFNPAVSALARALAAYQVLPAMVVQGNEPEAPNAIAPRTIPATVKAQRALAELRALRQMPRLLSCKASLEHISWARRINASQSQSENLKE